MEQKHSLFQSARIRVRDGQDYRRTVLFLNLGTTPHFEQCFGGRRTTFIETQGNVATVKLAELNQFEVGLSLGLALDHVKEIANKK